ncbi:MAG: Hsp20/alpha crystallin family protein [Erysipelotrichaceae bacterium]|nr:Hsp20/alpha crystallin family protein [Erysipelotrichaceae bacterium]
MRYIPRAYELFDDMFEGFMPRQSSNVMRTDVHEKDGYYNLDIELPGYDKNDISMSISDGNLIINAKHEMTNEEKDSKGNLIRSERSFGSCSRSFYVGNNMKAEDVKASFDKGILNVIIPTREQKAIETTQTIQIQ